MAIKTKRIERQLTDNLSFAIIPKSKDVEQAACILEDEFGNFVILYADDLDKLEQSIPGIVKNMNMPTSSPQAATPDVDQTVSPDS